MGRLPPILVLLVLSSIAAYAVPVPPDRSIPADPNSSYRIAVSAFRGEGLSPDNEYLLQGIPQLILQALSPVQTHHFSAAELSAYQRKVIDDAVSAQKERINTLLTTRSSILFQSADPTPALTSSSAALAHADERLQFLDRLDPSKVTVKADKPVEVVEGKNGQRLVPYPTVSAGHTSRELKLDLLITGTVAQVENYLVVTISVYDAAFGRELYTSQKTYLPNNVLNAAADSTDQLIRRVRGRDFGSLALTVVPASALVYIDGDFYGVGSQTIHYMTTGPHHIELRAPGYASKSLTVDISTFTRTTESVNLSSVPRPSVVVSSLPGGAAVYVASEWKGTTPVRIARPASAEELALRLKGYHDFTTTVGPETGDELRAHLMPDLFQSQDFVDGLRNRFYASFGAFALSMIVPVSFYSMTQDYLVNLQTATTVQEVGQLKKQITLWYYAYLGGAFISAALFTNTILDISDYLRAIR